MNQQTIYQLKLSLQDISPPIWRRLLVPDHYTLEALHYVIQCSMGWENYHLYSFEHKGHYFEENLDSTLASLDLQSKDRLYYIYDFGDNWKHLIQIEKQLKKEQGQAYPYCVTGKRQCPPEDCGGVWGYQQLLDVLGNKHHPEYEEMLEWTGENFDPDHFAREEINDQLKSLPF